MPKRARELSAVEVRRLVQAGSHAVGGVTGLYLSVSHTGARSWIFRIMIAGKRREMGLGGFPDVSLADARTRARELRQLVRDGIDPLQQKDDARKALKREKQALTFEQAVGIFFETKRRPEFSSDRHARIWLNSIRNHIYPHIGEKQIRQISASYVLNALEPLWVRTPHTGKKVRQRLEQVFEWAKVRGHYEGDNPAAWAGNLRLQLPSPEKVSPTEAHAAV